MVNVLLSLLIPVAFLCAVILLWLAVHLLANKRLGERKQGCKGPVPGENGEMLCCKGDGKLCDEVDKKAPQA